MMKNLALGVALLCVASESAFARCDMRLAASGEAADIVAADASKMSKVVDRLDRDYQTTYNLALDPDSLLNCPPALTEKLGTLQDEIDTLRVRMTAPREKIYQVLDCTDSFRGRLKTDLKAAMDANRTNDALRLTSIQRRVIALENQSLRTAQTLERLKIKTTNLSRATDDIGIRCNPSNTLEDY